MTARMSFYPDLDAYNADVVAARRAYNADQNVARGLCAVCGRRKRDTYTRARRCWTCAHERRKEAA